MFKNITLNIENINMSHFINVSKLEVCIPQLYYDPNKVRHK